MPPALRLRAFFLLLVCYFAYLREKFATACILYYPFKRAVKKIIQTIGLWDLLTRIRLKFS